MTRNVRAMAMLLVAVSVSLLVALSAAAAPEQLPAQQDPAQTPTPAAHPPIPEGRRLPFPDLCAPGVPAKVEVSDSVALLRNEVGWVATGFQAGSQVQMTLISFLNEEVQFRQSLTVLPWCFTAGTFRMDIPDVHMVLVRGTGSDGEPAQVFQTVTGIVSTLPRATATPVPTRPEAPSNFRASAINSSTVRVDWTDNSNDERGFKITSRRGEYMAGPNLSTLNIGGQEPGSITCYTLWAFNDAGQTFGGLDCLHIPSDRPGGR